MGPVHLHGQSNRAQGVIGLPLRGVEETHQTIADILVQRPFRLDDQGGKGGEVIV